MSSEGGVSVGGARLHRLTAWFDPESAGVVTILMGLFQVVLSVPVGYAFYSLPKLFILPLLLGILIVAGGSFTVANEKTPNRLLLQGCACSNVLGLLGALLGLCLYLYSISTLKNDIVCHPSTYDWYYRGCPAQLISSYSSSLNLLLILLDSAAMVLHALLSVSALKAMKAD